MMNTDNSVDVPHHNAFQAIVSILAQEPIQTWHDFTKIAVVVGYQLKLAGIYRHEQTQLVGVILYLVKAGVLEVNALTPRQLRLNQWFADSEAEGVKPPTLLGLSLVPDTEQGVGSGHL